MPVIALSVAVNLAEDMMSEQAASGPHGCSAVFDGLNEQRCLRARLHCPPIGRRYLR